MLQGASSSVLVFVLGQAVTLLGLFVRETALHAAASSPEQQLRAEEDFTVRFSSSSTTTTSSTPPSGDPDHQVRFNRILEALAGLQNASSVATCPPCAGPSDLAGSPFGLLAVGLLVGWAAGRFARQGFETAVDTSAFARAQLLDVRARRLQ
ncbi:unnamed protein product [Polarella glacialis]|uniref:Uncharacterized protein n=1 Tax=Polarella glacialis TaxID=89957 RepID=A0A813DUP6_POLGL|nr:unnamed protein product [Polarella glacialis]